tara:strand:+ start:756 stop:1019 length:264 start_codon:yes stop_codon:yes gene_type:complete
MRGIPFYTITDDAITHDKSDFVEKWGNQFSSFYDIIKMYEDQLKLAKKLNQNYVSAINNMFKQKINNEAELCVNNSAKKKDVKTKQI